MEMLERYPDLLITPKHFAQLAHLQVATIHRYHCDGRIPKADAYFGQTPIWKRPTVDRWIANRRRIGRPARPKVAIGQDAAPIVDDAGTAEV